MKKVAVLQSNYIPWKGYFDLINDVDLFIFYDDVQYTKNDWRNRNKVKTNNGSQWLTIPVKSSTDTLINEVGFQNELWAEKHYKTLNTLYSKAPYYKKFKDFLGYIYIDHQWAGLSELNQFVIKYISTNFLGITTEFENSTKYNCNGIKLDRLIDLLKKVQADEYISGPAARNYIDNSRFESENIILKYKEYKDYKEYNQFHPPFDHYVSILDLLFHTGEDAADFIFGKKES